MKITLACVDGLRVGLWGELVLSQEHLGLFDTPPNRRQIRFSFAIVGLLFTALILMLPLRNMRMGEIDAFIPMINSTMLAGELIIGTLLYAQAAVFRSRALTILASGYVCAALLLVPHMLTFPGAFTTNGLLGAGVSTAVWLAIFRRLAFPVGVILYVLLKRADSAAHPEAERPVAWVTGGLLGAIACAALLTLLATVGHDLLPQLALNSRDGIQSRVAIVNSLTVMLMIAAMVVLFRENKFVLDMWLLVALSGWLAQSLLNVAVHTRFTFGFYCLYGLGLVSNFIVMLALIAESNRLYARLALSVAARDREREARLVSMDAVAAAIAHEVRQPLTAVVTNASAGLRWLARDPPNLDRLDQSLRSIVEQGHHASELIASVRSVLTKRSGERTMFGLNGLVRETALLLDRELALGKISLEFTLDEALPSIVADRVQVQKVLVNLLTNAIQSLSATQGRPRCIAIHSAPVDGHEVLLDVSDNGIGIAAERIEHIFDAFFTTKATGTGLGLSLSRAIIEDHGGVLWVSTSGEQGATFHVQLPVADDLCEVPASGVAAR